MPSSYGRRTQTVAANTRCRWVCTCSSTEEGAVHRDRRRRLADWRRCRKAACGLFSMLVLRRKAGVRVVGLENQVKLVFGLQNPKKFRLRRAKCEVSGAPREMFSRALRPASSVETPLMRLPPASDAELRSADVKKSPDSRVSLSAKPLVNCSRSKKSSFMNIIRL